MTSRLDDYFLINISAGFLCIFVKNFTIMFNAKDIDSILSDTTGLLGHKCFACKTKIEMKDEEKFMKISE